MDFPRFRTSPWVHKSLVPALLLTLCPPTVFVFWYVGTTLDGSFLAFWHMVQTQGLWETLWDIWQPVFFGSPLAWNILAIFGLFQLLLIRFVPGRPFSGPVTPKGNTPLYKANGVSCFLITLLTFLISAYGLHLFSPSLLYDHLGELLGALNCFSLFFCALLYVKGIVAPSSSDHGISGNLLFDYYWGTELYPRILGWDIKQWTNCRLGMMSWPLFLIAYADKQSQLYGLSDAMLISVILQILYVAKFFLWETGYLRSLDIMHDRAGFMICWGCLVWLPCIYTSPALYLVKHPFHLGTPWALSIGLAGAVSIAINFLADRQRQRVRAKNGTCLIWRRPPILIHASYQTQDGKLKQGLLLASGWWGLSRHFHYIPELFAAFFWSLPALFTHFYPYFYVSFLTILLFDRAFRHDKRCSEKYGPHWEEYCDRVPYRVIPYIF